MTPQVDFYIMAAEKQRDRFACRLIEQGYLKGQRIFVRAQDAQHAKTLDDLLWTFRGGSFVPHEPYDSAGSPQSPVLISYAGAPAAGADMLVNLADSAPENIDQFERVAEIVDGDAESKVYGRERYRTYREREYSLQTQHVDAVEMTNRE